MNDNICGNCDFCHKSRMNDKGQVRCARLHSYVDFDGSCPDYFNHDKEDYFNRLLGAMEKGGVNDA